MTPPPSSAFHPDCLKGEVAIITGGGTGIGLDIAKHFFAHGADVVICSRNKERIEAAARKIDESRGDDVSRGEVVGLVCDVRDKDQVEQLVKKVIALFGKIDILVNNAAGNFPSAAERMSANAFSTVIAIDLMGTFLMTRAVVPYMIEKKKGNIISVLIMDPERGFPFFSHAGAAKAGILSLTSSWAVEWGKYGIRVNAIGPGPIMTEGVARQLLGYTDDEEQPSSPSEPKKSWESAFAPLAQSVPIGRVGFGVDIANAAVFLSSSSSEFITGVLLHVDGGCRLGNVQGGVTRMGKL